jgi:hypothetical protein
VYNVSTFKQPVCMLHRVDILLSLYCTALPSSPVVTMKDLFLAEAEVTLRLTVGQSVSQSVRLCVEPIIIIYFIFH